MTLTHHDAMKRTDRLWADLVEQSARVQMLTDSALNALFVGDLSTARWVIEQDDAVDRVDLAIERASVALLCDITRWNVALDQSQMRRLLTIVKVNNELERAADLACAAAQRTGALADVLTRDGVKIPPAVSVIANSVIGILRDVSKSLMRSDEVLARVVLQSEHTVEAFKEKIQRDNQDAIARGAMKADLAFLLHEVANVCERIADHATNIAEQVIYLQSGVIVRHTESAWTEVHVSGE